MRVFIPFKMEMDERDGLFCLGDALASYRKGQGIDKLTLLFRKEQKSYEENADTLCENTGRCSIDEQIHP